MEDVDDVDVVDDEEDNDDVVALGEYRNACCTEPVRLLTRVADLVAKARAFECNTARDGCGCCVVEGGGGVAVVDCCCW